MSDDEQDIRRSPKKQKRSIMPSDAAKNIMKNKEQKIAKLLLLKHVRREQEKRLGKKITIQIKPKLLTR